MTELFQELLVEEADEELGWQERALCAQTDPESFFPEKGGSTREAKKVCLACEVRPNARVRPRQRRAIRHLGRPVRAGTPPPEKAAV